jgi:hypothetical protein
MMLKTDRFGFEFGITATMTNSHMVNMLNREDVVSFMRALSEIGV